MIDIPFVIKRMNATLVDTNPPHIWRQEPSDEVDHAWLVAEDPRPVAISRAELIAAGHDPEQAVNGPKATGLVLMPMLHVSMSSTRSTASTPCAGKSNGLCIPHQAHVRFKGGLLRLLLRRQVSWGFSKYDRLS